MDRQEERLADPLERKWRRFKDAEHDIQHFKLVAPRKVEAVLPTIVGFRELKAFTGFHVFNDHRQTLQASFGHRSMFRLTIKGKTASENGASSD